MVLQELVSSSNLVELGEGLSALDGHCQALEAELTARRRSLMALRQFATQQEDNLVRSEDMLRSCDMQRRKLQERLQAVREAAFAPDAGQQVEPVRAQTVFPRMLHARKRKGSGGARDSLSFLHICYLVRL